MPKVIRSACLTSYVEVARSVGLDPCPQLKAAGLSRASLADPDTMIRASAVERLLEHPPSTTADNVREFVRALLPSGRCSIEHVARHLGMDRRTVHRHLVRDTETFSSIVDAVRAELAARYLTTTDRPLAEVAHLLGFSGLSALSRWFSARFDCGASAWRAAHRGRMVPAR